MHSVDSLTMPPRRRCSAETVIPVAGPGAPWSGSSASPSSPPPSGCRTDHGRWLLGEAIELKHRLPRLWRRVMAHDLPAWRARRIARQTIELTAEAAAFVDAQIAHVAHKVGPVVVDRLVDEAIARYMPETARRAPPPGALTARHFTVDHRQVTFAGTSQVYGELDLADALDLDAAVTARATTLKQLGSTDGPRRPPGRRGRGDRPRRPHPRPHRGHDRTARPPRRRRAGGPRGARGRRSSTSTSTTTPSTGAVGGGTGGEHRRPGHRRPDPRLVRQPVRPAWSSSRSSTSTSTSTSPPTRSPTGSPSRSHLRDARASSPGAPAPPALRPRPRHPARRGRPHLRVQHRTAVPTPPPAQDPRTSAGPTPCSTPAPTCGPAPTATSSCATTPAPATSPTTHPRARTDQSTGGETSTGGEIQVCDRRASGIGT